MPPGFNVVLADTTCFILLDKIGELELLKHVFGKVITTNIVATEYGNPLPDWIEIKTVADTHLQTALEIEVDPGEASAIALSIETEPNMLVLDDLAARHLARQLKLNYTGTFGVILRAKRTGHIKFVKPLIDKIKNTDFRVSDKLLL